jgi:hypothetical protein
MAKSDTRGHAPRQVFLAMLGSYNISDYTKKAAVAMFVFFAFFVILLMLNLLIAIMGESSRAVQPFSCQLVCSVWRITDGINI